MPDRELMRKDKTIRFQNKAIPTLTEMIEQRYNSHNTGIRGTHSMILKNFMEAQFCYLMA